MQNRFIWLSRSLALLTLISLVAILRYGLDAFYVWFAEFTVTLAILYILYRLLIKPSLESRRGDNDFWSPELIALRIEALDWYQFELFSESLLSSEGFHVERKGGAEADGGIDLLATSNGITTIVQCKHWHKIKVQEKVIRELLGSMTYYKGDRGVLFTIIGATDPAYAFAAKTNIEIFDAHSLALRAKSSMSPNELKEFLLPPNHHCPKCESVMILRQHEHESKFLGCSNFPRCRGVIKVSG